MNEQGAIDAVQYAFQTGRLDFVTAILAALTIVIAIAAIPLFLYFRHRAAQVAREEVQQISQELMERLEKDASARMEALLPKLVSDYMQLARTYISEDLADEIAKAQENGKDNDPE